MFAGANQSQRFYLVGSALLQFGQGVVLVEGDDFDCELAVLFRVGCTKDLAVSARSYFIDK